MANSHHEQLLRECIAENNIQKWNSWRENIEGHPEQEVISVNALYLKKVDLKEVNFQGVDLRSSNLAGAELQGAIMKGSNLQGACLYEACLQNVDFTQANISEGVLENTLLENANFQEAQLRKANFRGAYMQGANLRNTDSEGANFRGANLLKANFQGANLRCANFFEADLDRANFGEANVEGASFRGAFVSSTQLPKGITEFQIDEMIKWPKVFYSLTQGDIDSKIAVYRELQNLKSELATTKEKLEKAGMEASQTKKLLEWQKEALERKVQEKEQKLVEIETKKEASSQSIQKALESLKSPNEYISTELKLYEGMFWVYVTLNIIFLLLFCVCVCVAVPIIVRDDNEIHRLRYHSEVQTNQLHPGTIPDSESDIPPNLFIFLERHIPQIASFSLFTIFLALMGKTRRYISQLQERKRAVELFKGWLLAINDLSDSPEDAMGRIDRIIPLFPTYVTQFSEYSLSVSSRDRSKYDTETVGAIIQEILKWSTGKDCSGN